MKKYIFIILIFFIFISHLSISSVLAADRIVTCSPSSGTTLFSCSFDDPSSPFVSPDPWYPGKTLSKIFTIKNNWANTMMLSVKAENPSPGSMLSNVIILTITDAGGTKRYEDTLFRFFQVGGVDLGLLGSNAKTDFTFTIMMDKNAGDAYQNIEMSFELPFLFSEQYGNDSSSSQTTNQTISNSSTFSLFSQIQNVLGGLVGTSKNLLGTQTEGNAPTPPPTEEVVKGVSTTRCESCLWWPFALLEIIAIGVLLFIRMKGFISGKTWFVSLIIGVLTFISFFLSNQHCGTDALLIRSPDIFCRYFPLAALMLPFIPYIFRKKKTPQENPQG